MPPAVLREALGVSLGEEAGSLDAVLAAAERTLRYSVRTGHPHFFNQLYGGVDPAGILGEWVTALVNTSMYTYEAAPVGTLCELALIERMNGLVGFSSGEGIFTPGGSISNLVAVLAARHRAFPQVKLRGLGSLAGQQPVAFLSAEAHYSTPRAVSVAGLGTAAAVTVPTDSVGRLVPQALERAISRARAEGKTPFLVVATSGTTVPGAFDPLEAIAEITERHGLWLHVDASFGGGVLFSQRHRRLMAGVERADSVTWNPHKMMGLPLVCSAILLREKGALEATNAMHADYLFHDAGGPSYDLGDLSLQCGRRVDAFKLWFSWLAQGAQGYARRVDRLFELAGIFRALLLEREGFHLVRQPEGTTVCFRYLSPADRSLRGEDRRRREHELTIAIRQKLLESGSFMLNYAPLDGAATFRIVLANPSTTESDLIGLLDAIEAFAAAPLDFAPAHP
ncbi:MAG TPA: pyridoxal-dependent decarboxylase [Gemmatimonadales bacterium]|nr:pyridoxal-dependent decarboxylase [Gemmatimonadales bacterium]